MRRAALLMLAAAAMPVAGCTGQATYALVDGFEELCDGAPCGWTVQTGSSGTATWQETLPGEHGLRLEGGPMALLRETPGVELAAGADSSQLVADVTARCEDADELTIEVTVEALASGEPRLLVGSVRPPGVWDGSLDAVALGDEVGFGTFFTDVLSVRLVKGGTGTCELDYFALRITNGFE